MRFITLLVTLILFLCFVLLLPLACFVVAAIAEFRSHQKGPAVFFRISQIAVGTICVLALPFWLTRVPSETLRWTMVLLSLLAASLSLISKYASRVVLSCVFFGNAIVALLWYLSGPHHH